MALMCQLPRRKSSKLDQESCVVHGSPGMGNHYQTVDDGDDLGLPNLRFYFRETGGRLVSLMLPIQYIKLSLSCALDN
jgi:hypothetical protein